MTVVVLAALVLAALTPLTRAAINDYCNPSVQQKYCEEPYGGDYHTGCKYCGIGPACPRGTDPSGRGITNIDLQKEILDRHNIYRNQVKQQHLPSWPSSNCLQMLRWDSDLAEVAQIWADQCANVIYGHNDMYPKIFHERGMDRTTKNFHGPPGVGQNVAWALTKNVNFSKIIDDLWYKDINNFQPGYINEFNVDDSDGSLMTQIIWGRTTHVGCGWVQFPMGSHVDGLYPEGEYENFFVCNYGVGGNVPGEPVYDCLSGDQGVSPTLPTLSLDIQFGERYPTSSPEIQTEVQACFDAISCQNKESPQRNCQPHALNCMREMEKELLIFVSAKDRVRVFECRIEFVLCSVELEPGFELCNEYYEFCKVNRLTSPSDVLVSSKDVDLTTIRPETTMANRALTPNSRLTKPHPKIDISFYNATARTSYKLAICLEASRCNGEHNETCFSLQSECNQGLDLTPVPNPVRKKLSECSIDDILCHLDGRIQAYFCQRKYEICADIVIPNDITISTLPLFGAHRPSSGGNSHLEPFLFLLGLTDVPNEVHGIPPTENVLTNVTNNVLGALDSAFGGIEILPINTSINTLLNDNETLPIFQDIVVIIKTNKTDNSTEYSVTGQGPIDVIDKYPDLDNATVIFSTSNIQIGNGGHSSIRDPIVDNIKEKIRESLSEIATECNQHICFEGIDESKDTLHNPFPGLENVMAFASPGELQLKIAVCLQGIRCVRDKTCLKAQKKCIGKDNVVNYVKDDRIKISECVLEAHVCRMENGGGDERCHLTFTHCLNPIFDILNSKKYQFEFLNPDYENFTSLSDILKSFPLDIMPSDGDQVIFFSDEQEQDPQELIRDVTSNITEMIVNSDRKKPVQLIPMSFPGWDPDLRVSSTPDNGVISLLNSNPNFSFKTPNGTTSFLIHPEDNTFEMIEKTISSILENPIDEKQMKDVVRNITRLFQNSNAEVMELRPINDFIPCQSDNVVQGDVIILKKNDGQIALISSSPQLSFNSSHPIMSLNAEDLVPEEIRAIVENSIISNRINSPSSFKKKKKNSKKPGKTDMIDSVVAQIMNLIGKENSGSIQLRPINSNRTLSSTSYNKVSVVKENSSGDRVFQIISQSPEIMTFLTPENSTISVDLEALPPNQIPSEIHNMLNFIVDEGTHSVDPKEEVKSTPLRDIAQKISSGIRPEDNLVRIKPINGKKSSSKDNNIVMKENPQQKIIEVISHDEKTQFSTPENLIVEIDVKDLDNKNKMTSRIEDTLLSLVDSSKYDTPTVSKENEVGTSFYSPSEMEINEIIRQLAVDISLLSQDTKDVIVVKPQNVNSSDGQRKTNVERDLESKILKLKLVNPRVRFITPDNSTLAIDISNLNREDVTRRVEDTLRSILKVTNSKTDSMNSLLDNGFTNEIIQNLTSNALMELNGQIGGDFEILPIGDSHDLYDLLKDNDTLKFKVDFTVEPNEGLSHSGGSSKEEPLVIISNTPVQKVGSDFKFNKDGISESPIISVDNLRDISKNAASVVRNQLLHSFDQMEELSQGEKELDHVVDDIIREMNLIKNRDNDDEIILQPQLGFNPVREDNKRIQIPSSLKDNHGFKLPQAPIKIKFKNDDPKKKIKDVLNQISEVMKTVEKKRKMQIKIKDAAAQIVEKLPTELKDVGVILIPKNVESVESLDSGNKKIFLFAIPTEYPSTSLENEKEIYINLSNQHKPSTETKDSVLNLLVSKLHEEANGQAEEEAKEDNFILDLPIFGISVSEMPEKKNNPKNIIPLPGKTNVLSIPQFGLNVTVNNETDFLKILHEEEKRGDPIGNGSELEDRDPLSNEEDISDLFDELPSTNPTLSVQDPVIYDDGLPGITGFIEESPEDTDPFVTSNEGYFLEQEFTTTTEYSSFTGSSTPATSHQLSFGSINDDDYSSFKEVSKHQDPIDFSDYTTGQSSYDLYYDDYNYDDDSFETPNLPSDGGLEFKDHEFKIGFEPLKVEVGPDSTFDYPDVQFEENEDPIIPLNEGTFDGGSLDEDKITDEGEDNLFSSISTLGSNLPLIINSGLASLNVDYEEEKHDESIGEESHQEDPSRPHFNAPDNIHQLTNPDHNNNLPISDVNKDSSTKNEGHLLPIIIPHEESKPELHGPSPTLPIISTDREDDGIKDSSSQPIIASIEDPFDNPAPTLPIVSIKEVNNKFPSTLDYPSPTLSIITTTEEEKDEVLLSQEPLSIKPPNSPPTADDPVSLLSSGEDSNLSSGTDGEDPVPATTTALPYPYTNIVGGVRNVILGILATVMANNLSKFRDTTLGFDKINDPDIRRKIEENGIVFDENNINFTIPVAPNHNFEVDSLKEDLTSAIKSALSPIDDIPELKISVEDQTNKGSLSFGPMPSHNKGILNNAGQRPKFILDRFKFDENAYSLNDGYPEIASPGPFTTTEENIYHLQPGTNEGEANEDVISEGYDISDYTEWESHKIPSFPETNFDSSVKKTSTAGGWNINKPEIKQPENIESGEPISQNANPSSQANIGGGGWNTELLKGEEETVGGRNIASNANPQHDIKPQEETNKTPKKEHFQHDIKPEEATNLNPRPTFVIAKKQPLQQGIEAEKATKFIPQPSFVGLTPKKEPLQHDIKTEGEANFDSNPPSFPKEEHSIKPEDETNFDSNPPVPKEQSSQNSIKHDEDLGSKPYSVDFTLKEEQHNIKLEEETNSEPTFDDLHVTQLEEEETNISLDSFAVGIDEDQKRVSSSDDTQKSKPTFNEPTLDGIQTSNSQEGKKEEGTTSSVIISPIKKDEQIALSIDKGEGTIQQLEQSSYDEGIAAQETNNTRDRGSIEWRLLSNNDEEEWVKKVDENATRTSISEKINVRLTSTDKPRVNSTYEIISNEVEDDESINFIDVDPPTTISPYEPPVETVYSDVEYIPDNKIIDYTDDDKIYDQGLNFLSAGGSSANIVEASVVEDLNYARSIRNSRGMGIGTIASITIGILVLFGFGLLVFFAVARRRRRYLDDGVLYGIGSPSGSRTTFTDSPMGTVATPSMSELRPSFTDESAGGGNDPVLQLDGHQTIISSYNEFLNAAESLESSPPNTLRTKNLSESSEYLFARNIS